MPTIKITEAEYQQIMCDIECAIEELEELSSEVDWYVTDLPSRLQDGTKDPYAGGRSTMSLDYPNREAWLAFRANAVRATKYLHVSVDVGFFYANVISFEKAYYRTPKGKGKTYHKPVAA